MPPAPRARVNCRTSARSSRRTPTPSGRGTSASRRSTCATVGTPPRLRDGPGGRTGGGSGLAQGRPVRRRVDRGAWPPALLAYSTDMCLLDACIRPHGRGSARRVGVLARPQHLVPTHPRGSTIGSCSTSARPGSAMGGPEQRPAVRPDGTLLCSVAQPAHPTDLTPGDPDDHPLPRRALPDAVHTHDWASLERSSLPPRRHTSSAAWTLSTSGRDKNDPAADGGRRAVRRARGPPRPASSSRATARPWRSPSSALPDGNRDHFPAANVIDTDGERITRVVSWYDTAAVVPQIRKER